MNGSLDQFKATLQRRKERQERHSGQRGASASHKTHKSAKDLNFPKLKPEELEQFKETLRLKKQSRKLKQATIFVSIFAFITILILVYNL